MPSNTEAQQLKECECPARKALEEITKIRCGCPNGQHGMHKLPCSIVLAEEALSAPCPCEHFVWSDDPAIDRRVIARLRSERDSLRAELDKAKAYAEFEESQIVALCEVIGAEDTELAADKVQRLRSDLANVKTERNGYLKFLQQCAGALGVNDGSWEGRDEWMCAVEDALAASQERERLLREALALAESWVVADGAHGRADRPDIDASRSTRRANAIDQINEAFRLATPEGTK